MKGKTLLTIFIIAAVATVGYHWLPSYYNPFTPLHLDDPPGRITQYKLRNLTPQACASLLSQANQRALIRTQPVADSGGECPLRNVVRVRNFGPEQQFPCELPAGAQFCLVYQPAGPATHQTLYGK